MADRTIDSAYARGTAAAARFPRGRRALLIAALVAAGGGLVAQFSISIANHAAQGKSALAAIWFVLLFFTILTNILVCLAAGAALIDKEGGSFLARPSTQSAVAVFIAVVGIVYSLVLRALWNPQGWQYLADRLLHDASPVLYLIYWGAFVPKGTLRWSNLPYWLIYPLLYLAYALARGARGGVYPYPFIDVAKEGAATVALNSLAMLGLFLVVGAAIVAIDRLIGRRVSDRR